MPAPLATASTADAPPHTRRLAHAADLVDLFLPDIELCVLDRADDPGIANYFERAVALGRLGSGTRFTACAGDAIRLLALPELASRTALEADTRFAGPTNTH